MIHKTTAHYDGESVYAWSCACGAAETDYVGQDDAIQGGVWHEIDEQIKTRDKEMKESVQ
jgi:hypothetical protein